MNRNLRNTVVGGLGGGSILSFVEFRRGGIGIGIGTIGPLFSWYDEVIDFERDKLGPAREAAKKKCREESGLQ